MRLTRILLCLALLGPGLASAQNYPTKPVQIVTGGAGGGSDFLARLIAAGITGPMGHAVVVQNYATGVIPGQTVMKSAPDGYTLLLSGQVLWVGPLMREAPYDPMKDFAPISNLVFSTAVLATTDSLPVSNVKELIALAKAKPGYLNYASNGTGTLAHLSAELFKFMAGVEIQGVQFSNSNQRIPSLIKGDVHVAFDDGLMTLIKAGKLKGLAVTAAKRTVLAPGLPTIAESGVPGYESSLRTGLFAPAKTPEPIVKKINQVVVGYLQAPATREKLLEFGTEAVGSTPEEMTAIMLADRERFGKMIKATGITAQ